MIPRMYESVRTFEVFKRPATNAWYEWMKRRRNPGAAIVGWERGREEDFKERIRGSCWGRRRRQIGMRWPAGSEEGFVEGKKVNWWIKRRRKRERERKFDKMEKKWTNTEGRTVTYPLRRNAPTIYILIRSWLRGGNLPGIPWYASSVNVAYKQRSRWLDIANWPDTTSDHVKRWTTNECHGTAVKKL